MCRLSDTWVVPRAWLGPADALLRSDQPFESLDVWQCPSAALRELRDREINAEDALHQNRGRPRIAEPQRLGPGDDDLLAK